MKSKRNNSQENANRHEAIIQGVSIYKVAEGYNVFWEMGVEGKKYSKLNSVRGSAISKERLKKDAAFFDIQVNGPADLNEENFSSAIGKRVQVDIIESTKNPKYPTILFKELVRDEASAMDEVW